MFHSMVDKCLMTQEQQFKIFWQKAGHLELYIVPISTTNQVILVSFKAVIELVSVATPYELCMMLNLVYLWL